MSAEGITSEPFRDMITGGAAETDIKHRAKMSSYIGPTKYSGFELCLASMLVNLF